jgi:GNAT superfamily N-acetyltransferase
MTLERLRVAHDVGAFQCGSEDLDMWLRHAAITADRPGTARVYVHLHAARVAGYFALAPHHVRRGEIPTSIGRGSPDTIPGFLLARLALAQDLKGGGRGGELLAMALETILQAIAVGGGRLIVVDAVDENAAAFYRHYGFKQTPNDPGRLVMKASTAAASLGIGWH